MTITEIKKQQCEKTLYHYLKEHAEHTPEKIWLSSEREAVTFREALGRVESAAMQFLECGIKKGDLLGASCHALHRYRSPCSRGGVRRRGSGTDGCALPRCNLSAGNGCKMTPDFILTNEEAGEGISAGGNWKLSGGGATEDITFRADGDREALERWLKRSGQTSRS